MNKSLQNQYASSGPEQKLAILLHEIATPILIIQGFADLIRQHYESSNERPEEILDWINAIAKAAEHLKEVRDELM
jgi:signal transduction histidine kinase